MKCWTACCGTPRVRKRWAVAAPITIVYHIINEKPIFWLFANFLIPLGMIYEYSGL